MRKNLLPLIAASALLLSSCSTSQLARQADSDDVYYTEARAKAIEPVTAQARAQKQEQTYRTDEQLYADSYSNNRYDDDYSYSSRINRFYYNSPYRPYYDYRYGYNPWYTHSFDPFYYDPWYRPGVTVWINRGPRYWGYDNYYGYYNRYNNGYWGPYSYYNTYPGYGYGGYYNGYYNRNNAANNPNYRPRPSRGGNDTYGNQGSTNTSGGGTVVTGGERRGYTPRDGGSISSDNSNNGNPQPADNSGSRRPRAATPDYSVRDKNTGSTSSSSRPERTERPTQTDRYTPPPSRDTYSAPPSNSGSSDRGSGGSSSGGSSGGGRPSRGGN